MTGEKNRFKTHEKLWNIDDKSLKTPKHDAMVLWLMDESNLNRLNIHEKTKPVEYRKTAYKDILFKYRWDMQCLRPLRIFDDLNCEINDSKMFIETEVPLKSNPNFIAGYADLMVFDMTNLEGEYVKLHQSLIEVKPYIDSFGAVMRQLNSYKSYVENFTNICLFTLDIRFDKQFASQGVIVLHPPEDVDIREYAKEMGLND